MPNLIDAHYHTMWAALPVADLLKRTEGYIKLVAAKSPGPLTSIFCTNRPRMNLFNHNRVRVYSMQCPCDSHGHRSYINSELTAPPVQCLI